MKTAIQVALALTMPAVAPIWAAPVVGAGTAPAASRTLSIFADDGHNTLLLPEPGTADYLAGATQLIELQHIYGGGLARLLGGTVIPAEMLLTPAYAAKPRSGVRLASNVGTAFGGPANGGGGSQATGSQPLLNLLTR